MIARSLAKEGGMGTTNVGRAVGGIFGAAASIPLAVLAFSRTYSWLFPADDITEVTESDALLFSAICASLVVAAGILLGRSAAAALGRIGSTRTPESD
jgi:hypothetical protein